MLIASKKINLYLWSAGVHRSLGLRCLWGSLALLALGWVVGNVCRVLGIGVGEPYSGQYLLNIKSLTVLTFLLSTLGVLAAGWLRCSRLLVLD